MTANGKELILTINKPRNPNMVDCTAEMADPLGPCGAAALNFSRGIIMSRGEGEGREPVIRQAISRPTCKAPSPVFEVNS